MGMTKNLNFATKPPAWSSVREKLVGQGHSPQMRMIDGMPAFPDEDPPEDWKEIRVSLGGAMVTIRSGGSEWSFVVWGNSDEATLSHVDLLMRASSESAGA